ncbi:unnamed protein product [Rhizophagus irregularis]|nr:unnamed protein product [Rhizophagus irregularis]CAB5387068.1 unnamed protein product [Rhizophagus irregularis]
MLRNDKRAERAKIVLVKYSNKICDTAKHTDLSRQALSLSTRTQIKMVFALSSGWALNVVLSRVVILLYTFVSVGLRPSRMEVPSAILELNKIDKILEMNRIDEFRDDV